MNQLSMREKAMLVIGALGIIAATVYFGVPWIRQQVGGGEQAQLNQEELEKIQAVLAFSGTAELLEFPLRQSVGLGGDRVIPDELLKKIQENATVTPDPEQPNRINLNTASIKDLHALGLDKDQAQSVREYRDQLGQFTSIDQLADIKKTLFEDKDEQAVILTKLASVAKEIGIEPKDIMQIEPRLTRSTKTVPIPASARVVCITQIYLNELKQEAAEIQQRMEAGDMVAPQVSKAKRWFVRLPEEIPPSWRLKLIEMIQARQGDLGVRFSEKEGENTKAAMVSALRVVNATQEQVSVEMLNHGRHGFFGIGNKPVRLRVYYQDPVQGLVALFQQMEAEGAGELDRPAMEAKLVEYVNQCTATHHELGELLKKVPSSYNPRAYTVEMAFKGDLDKVVRLIEKVENDYRWIRVHGMKISIADEKQTLLQANLTMVAFVI